ncbi:MAG: hypothetical protein HOO96_04710 [Polyangiaceae bacterium]|nr:hypothetical protein [Polyangiaceae bacterium]
MGLRRITRALLAFACVLGSWHALRADDARLRWEGPACVESADGFRRDLSALLTAEERADLRARVEATEEGGRIRLVLSLELPRGGHGDRTLTAGSCALAAETAAVIVAMAAYPERTFAPPRADASAGPSPKADGGDAARVDAGSDADASPVAVQIDAGPAVTDTSRTFDLRVGILPTVQWGSLPKGALALALEVGVGFGRRWSFGVSGAFGPSQERAFGDGKGADLRLTPFAARGCFAPLLGGPFRLDGCLVTQLLWLHGSGFGFDVNHDQDLFAMAPGAAADFSLRPTRWFEWRATGELGVPLSRARFQVDGTPATNPEAVTLTVRTGAVFHF